MVEEDAEAMQAELKEAFRLYDKEGWFILQFSTLFQLLCFIQYLKLIYLFCIYYTFHNTKSNV